MVRYVNYIVIFHCSILTNIHSADTDFKYYNLFMWKREEFCRRHGQRQPRRSYCKESFFKVCNLRHLSIIFWINWNLKTKLLNCILFQFRSGERLLELLIYMKWNSVLLEINLLLTEKNMQMVIFLQGIFILS